MHSHQISTRPRLSANQTASHPNSLLQIPPLAVTQQRPRFKVTHCNPVPLSSLVLSPTEASSVSRHIRKRPPPGDQFTIYPTCNVCTCRRLARWTRPDVLIESISSHTRTTQNASRCYKFTTFKHENKFRARRLRLCHLGSRSKPTRTNSSPSYCTTNLGLLVRLPTLM